MTASVAKVGPVHIHQGKEGQVDRQDVFIRDSFNCSQLFLYGKDVNKLSEGTSYMLKNLRLHIVKNKHFLNTTLSAEFTATEIEPLTNLVDIPNAESLTKVDATVRIVSVKSVKRSIFCSDCNKKCVMVTKAGRMMYLCEGCNSLMKMESCKISWAVSIVVKDVNFGQRYQLAINNDDVHGLAKILNIELEDDLGTNYVYDCKSVL